MYLCDTDHMSLIEHGGTLFDRIKARLRTVPQDKDWAALQNAYADFAHVAATSSDMSLLFVAEAKQNIHRINLFADGVWALLGAIVAAIGIHGLCVNSERQANTTVSMRKGE